MSFLDERPDIDHVFPERGQLQRQHLQQPNDVEVQPEIVRKTLANVQVGSDIDFVPVGVNLNLRSRHKFDSSVFRRIIRRNRATAIENIPTDRDRANARAVREIHLKNGRVISVEKRFNHDVLGQLDTRCDVVRNRGGFDVDRPQTGPINAQRSDRSDIHTECSELPSGILLATARECIGGCRQSTLVVIELTVLQFDFRYGDRKFAERFFNC